MRKLAIVVEYLGAGYSGWQSQEHKNTVCDVLTAALEKIVCHKVTLFASGRTDMGVNAMRQYANFLTDSGISPSKLCLGVNTKLPPAIAVKECYEVPLDFDARRSAVSKTYLYKIYISPTPSPLRYHTHAQLYFPLDVEKMRRAASYIVGEHDFTAFMATGGQAKTTVRTVYSLDILSFGDEIHFEITGNGFLYNMVRIIAGTLIGIGTGKVEPGAFARAIASQSRLDLGVTAPAHGLTLMEVYYHESDCV